MNALLDDDEPDRSHRELTLSTGMILGIFFGLLLLCGLFFGFGYKMGNHHTVAPAELSNLEGASTPAANFNDFKPSAGSPASGSAANQGAARDSAGNASGKTTESAVAAPVSQVDSATHSSTMPAAPTPAPPIASGSFVVQVAAVSHQEDAELLVNALRTKGYPVSAHTEPQDSFFHIQVGPFSDRKDAEAAKQKLSADGYQPIIK